MMRRETGLYTPLPRNPDGALNVRPGQARGAARRPRASGSDGAAVWTCAGSLASAPAGGVVSGPGTPASSAAPGPGQEQLLPPFTGPALHVVRNIDYQR
ncbi:unnamed protein product [Gadus morhua 'NCC']